MDTRPRQKIAILATILPAGRGRARLAAAVVLMLLPVIGVQVPAQAVTRDVDVNSVSWDAARGAWKVNFTARYVSEVWVTTYKNGDFSPYQQYNGSEKNPEENAKGTNSHATNVLPDNPPRTAIQTVRYNAGNAAKKTASVYVSPYPGAGPGTGNATYLRVYGWHNGSAFGNTLYGKPLNVPQSATAPGNVYTLKVASFNAHCHPSCRHAAKSGAQIEALKWPQRRLAMRDAILSNPAFRNKISGVQDMPDVVGFQELSSTKWDGSTPIVAQDADMLLLLSGSYGLSTVRDVSKVKDGRACDPNPSHTVGSGFQERVFYRKGWYAPALIDGVEQSGSVAIGCTDTIKARTLQYIADQVTKKPVLASDTSQWRTAAYSLLERSANPGAGQRFWVISAHPMSNYMAPTKTDVSNLNVWLSAHNQPTVTLAALTKEHNTRRAESRRQAALDLEALSDSLTARVNVPVIMTIDANSDTSDNRNGTFGSVQSSLVGTGGFEDSTAYGTTHSLNWKSLNNFNTTMAPASNGDAGRIDYILFKGARGATNFRNNYLLGYKGSTGSTVKAKSIFTDPSGDTSYNLATSPPSDHNLQTVDLKMPY